MPGPRVRFSPAPTGFLHVGSARSALFNWLFARHTGGTLVLRIEDTDPARSRDDLVDGILRALRWLGLDWDEGPVRQSERLDLYRAAAERFLAEGRAYWCDCTREQIEARTKGSARPGYDGCCRDRGLGAGEGRVVRFRTPDRGETVVHDVIRGDVRFAHDTIEDFVILRSDGTSVFLLANAVDDLDMRITHVVRGEDLLSSTPRALLLRRALGSGDDPVFAHLPMIVNERREKLSKRRDDVALEEYRERGYLAAAMRNYLGLLGWAPADGREILTVDEMVAEFELDHVTKAPAFFDVRKLDHINAEYIRAMPVATFVREATPWLELDAPWPPEAYDPAVFESIAPEVQPRVKTLAEVPAWVDLFFLDQPAIDEAAWTKVLEKNAPVASAILDDAIGEYESCVWGREALHELTRAIGERHGLGLNKAQAPIRVAITGRTVGPPLFESLEYLGRERALERLREARQRLG
jgi:glutamyl-tRNA synthetase